MTLLDKYSEFVAGLASPNSTASHKDMLLTSALGLCGESGECLEIVYDNVCLNNDLLKEKLKDELGDVCWYFAFACNTFGLKMEEIIDFDVYQNQLLISTKEFFLNCTLLLQIKSAKFTDLVKKEVFHTKNYPKEKFIYYLKDITHHLNFICGCIDVTLADIILLNIKKLESRYPSGKFSVEDFMKKENAKSTDS